jgi:hypothetical protein
MVTLRVAVEPFETEKPSFTPLQEESVIEASKSKKRKGLLRVMKYPTLVSGSHSKA